MKTHSQQLESKVLKSDFIAGFKITENFYPANYQTPPHSHDFTYFCFVLEGDYTLNYKGRGHLLQPSKLLFFPCGENHACHIHTHSRCLNFQLNSQLLEYANANREMHPDFLV